MSITAEKIEQIARVIDPYAFDESGMTVDVAADAEYANSRPGRDNARDTAVPSSPYSRAGRAGRLA